MKAMILAAGLGTRLRPLTQHRPKALLPVANRPAIARVVDYLKSYGVERIVVNAHHYARRILDYLDGGRPFGVRIECRIEPEILGTGGGIRNTADFWGTDPFIVINADILTDIDLLRVLEEHRRSRALATLILHDRSPFNKIQVDADWRILEIPREPRSGGLAFTGIHVLDPQVLSHIPDTGFSDIVDTYRTLIQKGYPVRGFHSEGHYWHDIGSPPDYIRANRDLSERPFSLDSGCRVDPTARMEDWAVLGADVEVGKDAVISRSILWENVRVLEGARVRDSIVTDSRRVESDLQEEML